jgi:hypothetical protein
VIFNKKLGLLFCIILCSKTMESSANQLVVQRYQKQLEAENNEFMNAFLESFGISQSEWIEFKKTCENDFCESEKKFKNQAQSRCSKQLSPKLKALISLVLNNANLKRSIEVIPDESHDEYVSEAETFRSLMIINEQRFNKLHTDDDQAVAKLWHEVIHLYNDDVFTDFCLRTLKSKVEDGSSYINWFNLGWFGDFIKKVRECFNETKWHITYRKWLLFRERRADMLSGLISPEMAQAWVAMLKNYVANCRDCDDGEHPSGIERLAYMTKLRDELLT